MIDKKDCCDHGDHIHNQEVSIDYPSEWLYKIIGRDKECLCITRLPARPLYLTGSQMVHSNLYHIFFQKV